MRIRLITTAASALALCGGIVGCGGSSHGSAGGSSGNGIAAKSADAIVAAATSAIHSVKAVHVSGSVVSGGTPISLDLDLVSGKGGKGQMSEGGLSFQIVALNQVVYINGSDPFWRHFGGSAAAQLLHGKWLKAPATGQFSPVASLINLQQLFNGILSSHGKLTKGSTSTVAGRQAVAINDPGRNGTLYVATTGPPYPVQIVKAGTVGDRISFDRYNESVALSPPANAIDISKLG